MFHINSGIQKVLSEAEEHLKRNTLRQAERMFRRAMLLCEHECTPNSKECLQTVCGLADCCSQINKEHEAESLYHEALNILKAQEQSAAITDCLVRHENTNTRVKILEKLSALYHKRGMPNQALMVNSELNRYRRAFKG